jgi:hypothetical protein
MFIVGNAVVDDAVAHATFCCDVQACRGACCCLAGGRGAPLEDCEVEEITKAFPAARKYLSEKSIATIASAGLVEGTPGDYATSCVDHNECVFVYFDNGIARCSFERAYLDGLTTWRKPISCHLFPIRISTFGQDFLRYEVIDECEGGRTHGALSREKLHSFLREPLIRKYGEEWYRRFVEQCGNRDAGER